MAAEFPPWADIAPIVVDKIVRRVPCEVDRLHVEAVCRSWLAGIVQLQTPAPSPPLPWLLLPRDDDPTFACVPSGCLTHPFFVPRVARRARYFGSYDGVWLFLAIGRAQYHFLLNLNSFKLIDLPNVIRVDVFPELEEEHGIVILAATLSCQPTEQGCIVAAIVGLRPAPHSARRIAMWHVGDQVVSRSIVPEPEEMGLEVEDLLFRDGVFLFLTRGEHIRVCAVDGEEIVSQVFYFQPRGGDGDGGQAVIGRYLVESRGRLLMVVRFTPRDFHWPTSAFRVFERGHEDLLLDDGGVAQNTWRELPTLDGRMLFVGRGCSRSYDVAAAGDGHPYPGKDFEPGVYFLDDRNFHNRLMAAPPAFHNVGEWQYPCRDNGKWSEAPPRIKRCFPLRPRRPFGTMNYSPPVWLLP